MMKDDCAVERYLMESFVDAQAPKMMYSVPRFIKQLLQRPISLCQVVAEGLSMIETR